MLDRIEKASEKNARILHALFPYSAWNELFYEYGGCCWCSVVERIVSWRWKRNNNNFTRDFAIYYKFIRVRIYRERDQRRIVAIDGNKWIWLVYRITHILRFAFRRMSVDVLGSALPTTNTHTQIVSGGHRSQAKLSRYCWMRLKKRMYNFHHHRSSSDKFLLIFIQCTGIAFMWNLTPLLKWWLNI